MAKTLSQIQEYINENITENSAGSITGTKLNTVLTDLVTNLTLTQTSLASTIASIISPINVVVKGQVPTTSNLPTGATTGQLYFVGNDAYVWNGTEWVNIGAAIKVKNYIEVNVPANTFNNQSVSDYSHFSITNEDIDLLKSRNVNSVYITDERTGVKALGTITYSETGAANYGQVSLSYSYNGKIIIYDLIKRYSYTSIYIVEK